MAGEPVVTPSEPDPAEDPPPAANATPTPAPGGGAGQQLKGGKQRTTWYYSSVAIAVGFGVWALIAGINSQWAQLLAAAIVSVGLGFLTWMGGKPYGALSTVIGQDERTSTSKVQSAMWTLLLVWGLAFLLGQHVFEHQNINVVLPNDTWDQYLVVLGGPFAAAVLAKGIVSTQTANGTVTKTTAPGASPATISQIVQDDNNQTDLVDSQYFLFNLVAVAYFIVQIAAKPVLPVLPAPLLAVTSGAAALYVGNKAVNSNKPIVTSVRPLSPGAGQVLTILGNNLLGGGSASGVSVDLVNVGPLAVEQSNPAPTDSKIVATLPLDAPAGNASITVSNIDGALSDPWSSFSISSGAPTIIGLGSATVTPGNDLTVYGTGMISSLTPDIGTAQATVLFDQEDPVSGDVTTEHSGAQKVTVTVPAGVTGPQTSITVVAGGVASQGFTAYVVA